VSDFGFEKIAKIKPSGVAVSEHSPAQEKVDRAGEALGFTSREPMQVISRRKNVGPTTALNIRCPVRVFNPFAQFCEEEGLTYWEAIEKLMKAAGKM
jgi:hypothetical protein